ncbi:hypothetical protein GCM10027097_71730 [Amycolatopsis acidiphila]
MVKRLSASPPLAACHREAREELGIELTAGSNCEPTGAHETRRLRCPKTSLPQAVEKLEFDPDHCCAQKILDVS